MNWGGEGKHRRAGGNGGKGNCGEDVLYERIFFNLKKKILLDAPVCNTLNLSGPDKCPFHVGVHVKPD